MIAEVENSRREKSGDEIFELAMKGRTHHEVLGNAFRYILTRAYEADKEGKRYREFLMEDSDTQTALMMLTTLLHYLTSRRQSFESRKYAITEEGKRFCENILFPSPLTFY